MSHALITVLCPIPRERFESVRVAIDALGNPATPTVRSALDALATAQDGTAIHFASLTLFPTEAHAYLVFELSADGNEGDILRTLATRLNHYFEPVFAHAANRGTKPLENYWRSHVVDSGQGYFDAPGLTFDGTPRLSVRQILRDRTVAERTAELVHQHSTRSAIDQLRHIRSTLAAAHDTVQPADRHEAAFEQPTPAISQVLPSLAASFVKTFLWPLLLLPVAGGGMAWAFDFTAVGLLRAIVVAVAAGVAGVFLLLGVLAAGYFALRRQEQRDRPDDRAPDPREIAAIVSRENYGEQNHLAVLAVVKRGVLRQVTLRLVLWLIGQLAAKYYRPGWLRALGTVHFARWVTVPGTRYLIFLANYSGSWESYLEDFITRGRDGLTAIWSNTEGFPRTANLFQEGAADAARFRRWIRSHQVPTRFWYSAYPDLTTTRIRTNAVIRNGIWTIETEQDAAQWLSLFGSQPRSPSTLEANQIQSIVFGGMGFLRFSLCVGFRLGNRPSSVRAWLAEVVPQIAFGDGRKHPAGALILPLALSSLAKLGISPDGLSSFPQAFQDGMCADWRSRVLGDDGDNAPATWWWGGPNRPVDGLLLIYAPSQPALDTLHAAMEAGLHRHGHTVVMRVPLIALPSPDASPQERARAKREPFGFVDGVSQPTIRGTHQAQRSSNPRDISEPGEFVLGYPDNTGYLASPILEGGKDIGRNGTFLAIRQLEQDADRFAAYCATAAERIRERFPDWLDVDEEFVAAKLVGRWRDGSSLVRFPYQSATSVRTRRVTSNRQTVTSPADEVTADNDFLFGAEDPQGLRCPLGAHIRRANPRESLDPGSSAQLAIADRHRIVRVGRPYRPEAGQLPGLLFMCLSADLERQFEFVQHAWIQGRSFHGLVGERDPLCGSRSAGNEFTIPTREGPVRLPALPDFVRVRGGGYFFLAGRALLEHVATGETA